MASSEMSEGEEVTGVIFQFTSEAILFEFSLEGQSDQVQIGMVKPSGLKVGNRNIPASVKKIETLEKYIEVGDELECRVVKEEGLQMVKYQEEDEGGAMVEVEIQPDWRASKAVKLQAASKKASEAKEVENPFYNEEAEANIMEVEENKEEEVEVNKEEVEEDNKERVGDNIEKEDAEEEESDKEGLPEPVSATDTSTENNTGNAGNDGSEDNDGGEVNDKGDMRENGNVHGEEVNADNDAEKVGGDNSQHEENDGDTEEELLELEANPDEFEDLGVANSSQDNEAFSLSWLDIEQEEDIEVLEHVVNLKDSDGPPGEQKVQSEKTNIKKLTPEVAMEEPGDEKGEDPVCPPGEEPVLPTPVKVHHGETTAKESTVPSEDNKNEKDLEERQDSVRAKLVQFKKVARQKGKVSSGILEVLEGEFIGQRVNFTASCLFGWGHHLVNANFMYHLRIGEPMLVALSPNPAGTGGTNLARKVWLGSNKAEAGKDNLEQRAWLMERSLNEEAFLQWVNDKLPPKPFFPLKVEQYEAKVIMLIRENPKGDGALVRITTEGDMKDDLVVFERDDFYLCGVHVGEADMRFLLRPGDTVHVNPVELSERERKARVKKFPKLSEFEFRHGSLLAYLGDSRPRGPNIQPEASVELREFLDSKGMNVEEFSIMRGGQDDVQETDAGSKETTPLSDTSSDQATTIPFPPPQFPGSFPPPWAMPMPPPMGIMPPMMMPTMVPPPMSQASAAQANQVSPVVAFCSRVVKDGQDSSKLSNLIQSKEEVEQAFWLVNVLLKALSKTDQSKFPDTYKTQGYTEQVLGSLQRQMKITEKRFPGVNTSLDPKIQQQVALAKAKAAAMEIEKKGRIQAAANQALASGAGAQLGSAASLRNTFPNLQKPADKPMSDAMQAAMAGTIAALPSAINKDTLADFEKQSRGELQADSGTGNKGLQAMSDMKKRLEAFREAKKKKSKTKRSDSPEIIEVNNSGQAWAAKGKEHEEEKEMEPLMLLRKYASLGKKVPERGTNLDFNGVFHPSNVRTPLKSGKVGETPEFYTLGVLSYFMNNLHMDHPEYVRKCINAKVKAVRGPDRVNIQEYLQGKKDYVINLENLSHRELNPELFGGEAFAPEKLRRGVQVNKSTGEVVALRKTEAELKLDRWKEKNLAAAGAVVLEGDQRSSTSRSRTRSPGRRRRSRSRSSGRRKRSRSRSPSDYRSETSSAPRSPRAPPPPALSGAKRSRFDQGPQSTADQASENSRWNGGGGGPQRQNRFDQRDNGPDQRGGGAFDQRVGNGFDQRGAGGAFDQRGNGGAFDQRGTSSFDQRGSSGFDQRGDSSFDQRQNTRFDQRSSSGFDQREGSFDQRQVGGLAFDQRSTMNDRGFDQISKDGNGFDQRQNQASAFDQRHSNPMMSFDQRDQQRSGGFDQRGQQGAGGFDQRSQQGTGGFDQRGQQGSGGFDQRGQQSAGGFDQRGVPTASFGQARAHSGDRGEYGGDCYEDDFEYDSGRRNSLDNGTSQGQFQGHQGPGGRPSPWVNDPENNQGQEGNPAFVIGGGARRLGAMFGHHQ